MTIQIADTLLGVNLADDDSVCDAHKAIWHAQLDLLHDYSIDYGSAIGEEEMVEFNENGGEMLRSRNFDNYDICDPELVPRFVHNVKILLSWCVRRGVEIV